MGTLTVDGRTSGAGLTNQSKKVELTYGRKKQGGLKTRPLLTELLTLRES